MWAQQQSNEIRKSSVVKKNTFHAMRKKPTSMEQTLQENVILDTPASPGITREGVHGKQTSFLSLTQQVEQFPCLDETCNINITNSISAKWSDMSLAERKKCMDEAITPTREKDDEKYGKFIGMYKNDGASGEFDSSSYPHSLEMFKIFRQKFGLSTFRPTQVQAMNATLLGFDCFVLMPTGGRKSLCYHLPALVSRGVTIVVSPLKSLILDQIQKLHSLDIPATHFTSSTKDNRKKIIYMELIKEHPDIKILYVTPEKIFASQNVYNILTRLYERDMLARFVIDEAYCISQWGHNFRPAYKKLNTLRDRYPKVPIMVLTATAAPRVRTDILHHMGITEPKWFMSSFNRPNLKYSVRAKTGKACYVGIATLMQTTFHNTCSIVYCLSRKDCDECTEYLQKRGSKASSYHAGVSDYERTNCQEKWFANEIYVICATIAFGMGIDKPDVRFVIHATLPKSLERYYQENGRVGRDGEKAECILYYRYADMYRIRTMIDSDTSTQEVRSTYVAMLLKMVAFCENITMCRRTLQLEYFGEIFDEQRCLANKATACDTCTDK
ncbi:Bloom syndrome protein homolog, partial [Temnothorax curvispinosus]|uniref:ATP-dependent DNA helicase n=1 Tax=Temnothorax curvispinosus TaxID=300111 RepID=A0A6J1REE6_9HYME